MESDLDSDIAGTNQNKKWTTANEGTFADLKCLGPLNPEVRVTVLNATNLAHECLVMANTQNRVRFGQACHAIKKQVGESGLHEIARKFWFPDSNGKWSSLLRTMQVSMQLYRFYNRKGPRLTKEIPIDSALNIFRHVKTLPKKAQNELIRKINESKKFNGIGISKSKQIRKAVIKAKGRASSEKGGDMGTENPCSSLEGELSDLVHFVPSLKHSFTEKILEGAARVEVIEYGPAILPKLEELAVELRSLEMAVSRFRQAFEAVVHFNKFGGKKKSWKNTRWSMDELPWSSQL